jgi:probable rRNA maturation factor
MAMEITIKNTQRLIRINPQRIERILRKAVTLLAHREQARGTGHGARKRRLPASRLLPLAFSLVEVSVLLVNDKRMRELNRLYRDKDTTTDVLSFPQQDRTALRVVRNQLKGKDISPVTRSPSLPLGDIVISLPQAKRQAEAYGAPLYEELARLLVHGLLHLLDYDHERNSSEARSMRALESEVLRDLWGSAV